MEQLMAELGLVMDRLWPNYIQAAAELGLARDSLPSELVLGGWSPKSSQMMATAYASMMMAVRPECSRGRAAWRRLGSHCAGI